MVGSNVVLHCPTLSGIVYGVSILPPKDDAVSFRIARPIRQVLVARARKRGQTLSEFMRRMAEHYVATSEQPDQGVKAAYVKRLEDSGILRSSDGRGGA